MPMESLKCRHSSGLSLLILLSILVIPGHAQAATGAIQRTKKQLLLASLQPTLETTSSSVSSQLFLTSPSGSSSAYLVRQSDGHELHDYCYIQIQETSGGSVWQSSCASVSRANICNLVFSESGIEIFDGNKYSWSTDSIPRGDRTEILTLPDGGDMQIVDQTGTIVWSASQNDQIANQNCRLSSSSLSSSSETSVGVSNSALTPFATPSDQSSPLEQSNEQTNQEPQVAYQQQQLQGVNSYLQGSQQTLNQPFSGFNQPFSSFNRPYGSSNQQGFDGAPFEYGMSRKTIFLEVLFVYLINLVACLVLFF